MTKPQLAEARRLAGLTQQQLADRVGINRVQLAKYENGAQSPSVDTATRIAAALGMSVEELFGHDQQRETRIDRLEARLSRLEERYKTAEAARAR